MSRTASMVLVAVIAAVVGGIAGAAVVNASQGSKIGVLEAQLAVTKQQLASTSGELAVTTAKMNALAVSAAKNSSVATASATTTAPAKPAPSKVTRQFAFIKKVSNSTGTTVITADYAEFLTGKAAATAAAAHGDESPPPNDYYIVNDNKLLRKLPVKAGIDVRVSANPDGTSNTDGYTLTLNRWVRVFNGALNPPQQSTVQTNPYWLTIANGVVTKIEQQYVP